MRPPKRRVASAARFHDAFGEPSRSTATKSARPPAALIGFTTAVPRSILRPLTTTCALSAAKLVAMARPMLLVAPVTSAVLLRRREPIMWRDPFAVRRARSPRTYGPHGPILTQWTNR